MAGYVGVVDERVDLDLIAGLAARAARLDDADSRPGGQNRPGEPAVKRPTSIPGLVAYPELPPVMAGFDVALMPFALNEATRAISPTKTLEYLAAGLPVVSTRVPDVVTDYADVVHLADDAPEFAAACREVLTHPVAERDQRVKPIQARQEWDHIASAMAELLDEQARRRSSPRRPGGAVVQSRPR